METFTHILLENNSAIAHSPSIGLRHETQNYHYLEPLFVGLHVV